MHDPVPRICVTAPVATSGCAPEGRWELPADVIDAAVKAAARARYLDRWPDADERRVERYAVEMAADPRYRVEIAAAAPVLLAAGRRQAADAIRAFAESLPEGLSSPAIESVRYATLRNAAHIAEGSVSDG